MKDPPNLAGAEPRDQHLWNTYVYWARAAFGEAPPQLMIANPANRISPDDAALLRALLFAAFVLEYRLRSVYDLLDLPVRERDGLWQLLANLERRTKGMRRKQKLIVFPDEWKDVRRRLQKLLEDRNRIAHGKREPVANLLSGTKPSLKQRAADGYNAVIDAIRIINVAIGYDSRRGKALTEYYARLMVDLTDGA